MNILTQQDCKHDALKDKKIAIIGYGSQGRAHALNLRDGGYDVVVGLRDGSQSISKVEEDDASWALIKDIMPTADIIMLLIPDEDQADFYTHDIEGHVKNGVAIGFAHGLNIHFDLIKPSKKLDIFMVAPKAAGYAVRALYKRGGGAMAMMAVHQDASSNAHEIALSYACGIGAGRAGVIQTSFAEECEADLFGEQAVLCGGLSALLKAGFETLVDAGFAPEVAYIETIHEAKIIMDLIYERGMADMRKGISNTAEYGDYTRGQRIINDDVKKQMQETLNEIRNGSFVKEYLGGNREGLMNLKRLRKDNVSDALEVAGQNVRKMAGIH